MQKQVKILKMQVLDYAANLAKVKKVENVHFNYAVSKTLNKLSQEQKDLKNGIEWPDAAKDLQKERDDLLNRFRAEHGLSKTDTIDTPELRAEMVALNEKYQWLFDNRKAQLRDYREMLREPFMLDGHFIPVVPVKVSETETRDYIPSTISIMDLYNADAVIDWDTCPHVLSTVEITGEMASRVSNALDVLGNLTARTVEHQRNFALIICFILHQMEQEWLKVQCDPAYIEWIEKFETQKMAIVEKYSKKTIVGEPDRGPRGEYRIENVDAMTMELSSLDIKQADVIKAKNDLMKKLIPVSVSLIPYYMLPEDLSGEAMDYLFPFISEEDQS